MMFTLFLALTACHQRTVWPADVKLEIDGVAHDFHTSSAEWEQPGGEPISVYLLPDDKQSGQPYLNLRYYSGNPVGHVWVRYALEGDDPTEPPKWECFVPGVLRDGTETLTWKKDDGTERHRTETGEATCKMTTQKTADSIVMDYDMVMQRKGKKKSGEDKAPTIHVRGHAELQLTPRG